MILTRSLSEALSAGTPVRGKLEHITMSGTSITLRKITVGKFPEWVGTSLRDLYFQNAVKG